MNDTFPLRPREIFDELRKVIVGQDAAVRELSVALVKHLVGHPAPNIPMIANSGSDFRRFLWSERRISCFFAVCPPFSSGLSWALFL